MDKKAIIDPGLAGPFNPQLNNVKNAIAQIFPTIGAIITTGFIKIYGK